VTRARLPLVVVLVVLLVGALAIERDHEVASGVSAEPELIRAAPTAASPDVLGSTWYCAAGSAGGDDGADHTVLIANPGTETRQARITAFPGQADPVEVDLDVAADVVERVRVGDLVDDPASVMVEVDGGEVAVSHELTGPTGTDTGSCASSASDLWHFAWGDTSRDARALYAVFNPFPGDAVVDFGFVTIDGARQPQALAGIVVPAQSVVVVDAAAEVARRDQVSATVTARSGRVVVERIQTFDDDEEMLEGFEPRRGLTVDLGVPMPMESWVHPSVRLVEGLSDRVVVYNPGSATAEVDIEVLVGGQAQGGIEPFELTVPPNRYEMLDLSDQPRLAELFLDEAVDAIDATVVVRSLNGVPVVAERVTVVPTAAQGPGVVASTGTPVVGRRQIVVDPRPDGSEAAALVLFNPDPERLVTGAISIRSRGTARSLDGYAEFELGPGGRLSVDDIVDRVSGEGNSMLVIESTHPIAVGTTARRSDPADRLSGVAIGRGDDVVLPPAVFGGG
jgi:hypothetical protein